MILDGVWMARCLLSRAMIGGWYLILVTCGNDTRDGADASDRRLVRGLQGHRHGHPQGLDAIFGSGLGVAGRMGSGTETRGTDEKDGGEGTLRVGAERCGRGAGSGRRIDAENGEGWRTAERGGREGEGRRAKVQYIRGAGVGRRWFTCPLRTAAPF